MATDADFYSTASTATVAGLFVAGLSLGAVYAFNYARLGQTLGVPKDDAGTARPSASTSAGGAGDVRAGKEGEVKSAASVTRKGRRKRKGKGVGEGVGEGEGEDEGERSKSVV